MAVMVLSGVMASVIAEREQAMAIGFDGKLENYVVLSVIL